MPRRVGVSERIVQDIAVPVQAAGVAGLGHDRIRLREAAQRSVVESCVVKVQPDGSIFPLACKAKADG